MILLAQPRRSRSNAPGPSRTGWTFIEKNPKRPARPTEFDSKWIRYLWAFPNTLVGLLFTPLVLVTGAKGQIEVVDGVLELHGRLVAALLRRCVPIPGGAAAITFGHVVLGRDRMSLSATRAHERVHVRQCEVWGPAFLPAYLLAGLWALITGAGAYEGNYFERQACLHAHAADDGVSAFSGRP